MINKNRLHQLIGCLGAAVLLCAYPVTGAAYDKATITGCAVDITGRPISGAEVWIEGLNYEGGKDYKGDDGVSQTAGDGTFSISMRKGSKTDIARAKLTIWSTIAGSRSKGRGGVYETTVQNAGEERTNLGGCGKIVVEASYFVGGIVTGKDETQREGMGLRLKMEAPDQGDYSYANIRTNGRFEFNPWFDTGVRVRVIAEQQPWDEICEVKEGSRVTGRANATNIGRFIIDFSVVCRPNPAFFAKCDAMQRDINAALTAKEPDRASSLLEDMEKACGRNHPKYADGISNAREQISSLKAAPPPQILTRRGENSSAALFQGAISQAEQEERDRPAREAREKAERARLAEQQRLAALQQNTPAPAPQLSAKDQLIASLDQRIANARQQCLASEGRCNTGCLGVGAVGIFSALSGNRAAASASQDQLQQCSNRCDQAKRDCDQQVAALEQERQQVTATGSGPTQFTMAGGTPKDGICTPTPSVLQDYIRAQHAFARATDGTIKPATTDSALKYFEEVRRTFGGLSAASLRNDISRRRADLSSYRSVGVVADHVRASSLVTLDLMECELKLKEAQAPAQRNTLTGTTNNSTAAAVCASSPRESFRNFDSEMGSFGSKHPNQSSRGGARDQNQYMLFYATNGLQILEKHRNCLSPSDYQANKLALENARDKAKQACEQLSTSQGSCTPTYPANWR